MNHPQDMRNNLKSPVTLQISVTTSNNCSPDDSAPSSPRAPSPNCLIRNTPLKTRNLSVDSSSSSGSDPAPCQQSRSPCGRETAACQQCSSPETAGFQQSRSNLASVKTRNLSVDSSSSSGSDPAVYQQSVSPTAASRSNLAPIKTRNLSVDSSSSSGSDPAVCHQSRSPSGSDPAAGPRSPVPPSSPVGPRFKLVREGLVHVCRLNHTRTVISKLLSSRFLRRWEAHHVGLEDTCIASRHVSLTFYTN